MSNIHAKHQYVFRATSWVVGVVFRWVTMNISFTLVIMPDDDSHVRAAHYIIIQT